MLQLQLLPPFMIQPTAQDPVTSASISADSLSASQKRIHLMLTKYITTIRQENYLQQLNQMLCSVSVGGSEQSNNIDIEGYYANRPELRNYTLGLELDRDLDYTLILKDGTTVTDKEEIRRYFHFNNTDAPQSMEHKEIKYKKDNALPMEELLIRAANQSLLADALAALSSSSEEVLIPSLQQDTQQNEVDRREQVLGLILSGPILNMTSVVEKCHFTIDIQRERVEGICVLAIVIPNEDRRLVLARAILVATFIPGEEFSRKLQYDMKMVKCHHFPTSRTLRDAAISIATDQDNLLFQSCPARVQTEAKSTDDDNTNDWDDKIKKLQRSFSLFNR